MPEAQASISTPLRESARQKLGGCWRLSDPDIDYLDGGEDRLLEIVKNASDLGSLSDELEAAASSWPERYSLSRSRANILRPLALEPQHAVLEVGAGCGAITRYLGESCGIVDALEPVASRAAVARERTRDLPTVEVFVGGVSDIPATPAYDVVVLVGVLEYAGAGSPDPAVYVDFLSRFAGVLRPGGHIVCAIENRLGVKYLAGAPEDHTGRVFDGPEAYPRGAHARTFSRGELAALFTSSGLDPTFFHAFPDYKLTRAVFSDDMLRSPSQRQLAWLLPAFPSPDWAAPRPHLLDERNLWRSLTEDEVAGHFSNSFLVVASPSSPQRLWDTSELARFFSTARRSIFATETRVIRSGKGVAMKRSRLAGPDRTVIDKPVGLRVSDHEFCEGEDFVDVLARSNDAELGFRLEQWRRLVESQQDEGPRNIDLVPHNLILTPTGQLVVIDQEWWVDDYAPVDVINRGILWLALGLADRTPPERWPVTTVAELAVRLRDVSGMHGGDDWLSATVRREAELQAQVGDHRWKSPQRSRIVGGIHGQLQSMLQRKLADCPLGAKEHERRLEAEASLRQALDAGAAMETSLRGEIAHRTRERQALEAEVANLATHVENLNRDLSAITGSLGWRLLNVPRAVINLCLPPGSPQRAPFRLARRAVRLVFRRPPGPPRGNPG